MCFTAPASLCPGNFGGTLNKTIVGISFKRMLVRWYSDYHHGYCSPLAIFMDIAVQRLSSCSMLAINKFDQEHRLFLNIRGIHGKCVTKKNGC